MQKQLDKIKASGVVAGVHTVEVKAKQADYRDRETGELWDYVSNHYQQYGEHVIVLNPHKANLTPEGLYKCLYGDRAGVDAAIARAAQEMQWSDDWRFSRLDFCFDLQCPYKDSDKLVRLFQLMVAKSAELNNLWSSIDPATLVTKSTCVRYENQQRKKHQRTMKAVEHYNRVLVDQKDFDTQVINRLEFRTGGLALTNCGGERNMRAPVDLWLGIIDKAMTEETLRAVEDQAARAVYDKWVEAQEIGGAKRIAQFFRMRSELIYTRRQLEEIFTLAFEDEVVLDPRAKAKEAVRNLLKTESGFKADLYTLPDLVEFSALLWNTAECYFESSAAA